jgi:hypothetical protein
MGPGSLTRVHRGCRQPRGERRQASNRIQKMEASAGFEPAVEVLQVALNGPPRSARVRSLFRIACHHPPSPPSAAPARGRCRHHCRHRRCRPPRLLSQIGGSNPFRSMVPAEPHKRLPARRGRIQAGSYPVSRPPGTRAFSKAAFPRLSQEGPTITRWVSIPRTRGALARPSVASGYSESRGPPPPGWIG